MAPKIIDVHVHPDKKNFPTADKAAGYLHSNFKDQVQHMLLIGLDSLDCSNEDLAKVSENSTIKDYFTLAGSLENFSPAYVGNTIEQYFETGIFKVLKLHPRLQKFSMSDERVQKALGEFSRLKCPVLVDCFHDGHQLLREDPLKNIVETAVRFPNLNFIVGHSGGFEILRALTFAKSIKNLYLDLSYSLLYYRESSVRQDFAYAIKNMKGERILFGTDYPDRAYDLSLKMSFEILEESHIPEPLMEKFLYKNAAELLKLDT